MPCESDVPAPRIIPSIEQLRQRPGFASLEGRYGRASVVEALREEASALRAALRSRPPGRETALPGTVEDAAEHLRAAVEARLARTWMPSLRPVVNATGVIVHTNLGRAPLGETALQRVVAVAGGYANLEYDLAAGARGRRDVHAEALLTHLTGAAAAVVVNNNAAATMLLLAGLARGREVIISRGELVEIGGGFRVPDVMAQSGARLREVGTTNRTRAADYAAAISDRTALILRVHPSNFRVEGFTERPAADEIVALGRRFGVLVAEDLGSGNLLGEQLSSTGTVQGQESGQRPGEAGTATDPVVTASVAAGFDAICFSGDKLLGGPQAGIVLGRQDVIEILRMHPLMRALRVDKMTYAALEGTLLEYAAGRARETVPVAAMLSAPLESIEARAHALVARLGGHRDLRAEVIEGFSTVGGGSAPGSAIPTRLVALGASGLTAAALEARLRGLQTPVIARIEHDRVVLDLRTVRPEEDERLGRLLLDLAP